MNTEERRAKVLDRIKTAEKPVNGTALSKEFSVSRQIIVGDIAIIRAMGVEIYATPRGYLIPEGNKSSTNLLATITCSHDRAGLQRELDIIVDNGGKIRDVIVEHPLYGEIRADLLLNTRRDVAEFIRRMDNCQAHPLLIVTGGIHLHTLEVPNEATLAAIKKELQAENILAEADTEI